MRGLWAFLLLLPCFVPESVLAQSAAADTQSPTRCNELRGASAMGCGAREEAERSRLWRPRMLAPYEPSAGVELRGVNDGYSLRPGLEVSPTGFETLPRGLPEHAGRLELSMSEQFGSGLRNVDAADLVDRYPGTLTQDLVGGRLRYRQLARGLFAMPLGTRAGVFAEAIDERMERKPLGSTVDQREWRPRYTVNTTLMPNGRTHLTLGARYDRISVEDAGIGAFTAPSAARDTRLDESTLVFQARRQWLPRLETAGLYEFKLTRDDAYPQGGLRVPGHYNLDAIAGPTDAGQGGTGRIAAGWGNDLFRIRRHEQTHFADLNVQLFLDGLLSSSDAHTFKLGAQLERSRFEQDESRTGGFTFVDVLPSGSTQSVSPRELETNRDSWQLFSSDRGDELHAKPEQWSSAVYLEDAIDFGARVSVTPGVRYEQFRGGFRDGRAVYREDAWSPRVALRVDLLGEGSTFFYGQVGRFAQRLDPSMYVRASEGRAVSPLSYWDFTGPVDLDPPPAIQDPRWQPSPSAVPAAMGRIDPKLQHPYLDRLLLGLSHYVAGARLTLTGRYELTKFEKQLGLFDQNGFGAARARNYVGSTRESSGVTVPYVELRPEGDARYVIGNAPSAKRTMHVVRGVLAYDGLSWLSLRTTFVYTVDRGNFYAPRALSLEWFQPSSQIHSYGNMSGVDRLRATLSPIFYLPGSTTLEPTYDFRSGAYYSRTVQVSPNRGPRAFIYDEAGRGAYRYPRRHLLHLAASTRLPGTLDHFGLRLQIYNLTNARYVTGFRETAGSFRSVRALEAPFEAHLRLTYDL